MAASDIMGLVFIGGIIGLLILLTVAVTILALNARKLIDENIRLRGEVERLKQSPKYSVPYTPAEYEMPRSSYERPYDRGFEQRPW